MRNSLTPLILHRLFFTSLNEIPVGIPVNRERVTKFVGLLRQFLHLKVLWSIKGRIKLMVPKCRVTFKISLSIVMVVSSTNIYGEQERAYWISYLPLGAAVLKQQHNVAFKTAMHIICIV